MRIYSEDKLKKLVTLAQEGDQRAFDDLRHAFSDSVRGFIRARTWRGDDCIGEIEQDVWIKVYEQLSTYDPIKGAFYTFITRCAAIYVVQQWNKHDHRTESLDTGDDDGTQREILDNSNDPHELMKAEIEAKTKLDAFQMLSKVLFLCGGYPHQQFAFAFLKLIYGSEAKSEGKALQVVERHADTEMQKLAVDFISLYKRISHIDESQLKLFIVSMAPLNTRLGVSVRDLLSDRASQQTYLSLMNMITGDTTLSQYCACIAQSESQALSDWAYKVQKKIVRVMGIGNRNSAMHSTSDLEEWSADSSDACKHCNLRNTMPCSELDNPLMQINAIKDTKSLMEPARMADERRK